MFTGMVTLPPMSVAPVCHVGDPLQITCTASVAFIRWSILQANEQGTLVEPVISRQINSRDANQMSRTIVNSSTFTFKRISAQDDLPLNTTLSIDSVSIGLNGAVVRCADLANPMTSASATISIISDANITQSVTLSKLQPIKPILNFSINRSVHSIHGCYIGRV